MPYRSTGDAVPEALRSTQSAGNHTQSHAISSARGAQEHTVRGQSHAVGSEISG